jgi:pSer/pThr/pTyr-binding forkhead associated (FHA) protein
MKLSLVVLTPGKMQDKQIPVLLSPFLIGRDVECQLRPASVLVSHQHCAVLVQDSQAHIRDFDSTNGTFVNGEPVRGEQELLDGDLLKVGPLEFRIALQAAPAASEPMLGSASDNSVNEETAAALLLSPPDEEPADSGPKALPEGSTIVESRPASFDELSDEDRLEQERRRSGAALRAATAKSASGDTSSAAQAILEGYRRRPRKLK